MAERKYSVKEIDWMRSSVATLCDTGGGYNPEQRSKRVEDRLRTYMVNGTDPEELAAAANEHMDRLFRQQKAISEWREQMSVKAASASPTSP